MSLDHLNPDSNLKALGMFIFGGSASFGVMQAGFHLNKILEISDDMIEKNAYHWTKNFDNIPIILPSEWENEEYLNNLHKEKYDLIMCNCPCSSLSQINRNASVDGKNNVHFYRLFNAFKHIQPKTFIIENAPTLVKLGYPIILDMINTLGDTYKFTIIRDYAGNHNVAMKRMRTLLVGWKKDEFDDKIPLLQMNKQKIPTIKDAIGDLYNYQIGDCNVKNHVIPDYEDNSWYNLDLFNYVKQDSSTILSLLSNWDLIKDKINNEKCKNDLLQQKAKLDAGKRIWDKSPYRMSENASCPSLTSVTQLVHPIYDRSFSIREYSRIMNYPDEFEWFPNECKINIIQNIAQGVPANFVEYISTEVKETILNNRELIEDSKDKNLIFQHHTHELWKSYTIDELIKMNELESDKSFNKL